MSKQIIKSARPALKEIKAVLSNNREEARKRVLNLYKLWYRQAPYVGFGQTICRPVGPKCSECRCNDTCPTGKKQLQAASKKSKGAKIKIEKDE